MAPLSFSQEFIPAPQATNRRTATTYGHHHQYMRPGQPGPGWGDYDRFDHWQSCGRRLPEDLLDKDPERAPADPPSTVVSESKGTPDWALAPLPEHEGERKKPAPRPIWTHLEGTKQTRAQVAAARGGGSAWTQSARGAFSQSTRGAFSQSGRGGTRGAFSQPGRGGTRGGGRRAFPNTNGGGWH